jgi:hypothetical protein
MARGTATLTRAPLAPGTPWNELPACAVTLAYATSGAAAVFLERTYPRG